MHKVYFAFRKYGSYKNISIKKGSRHIVLIELMRIPGVDTIILYNFDLLIEYTKMFPTAELLHKKINYYFLMSDISTGCTDHAFLYENQFRIDI